MDKVRFFLRYIKLKFSSVKSAKSRRSYICFVLKKKSKWLRGSRVKPLAFRLFSFEKNI